MTYHGEDWWYYPVEHQLTKKYHTNTGYSSSFHHEMTDERNARKDDQRFHLSYSGVGSTNYINSRLQTNPNMMGTKYIHNLIPRIPGRCWGVGDPRIIKVNPAGMLNQLHKPNTFAGVTHCDDAPNRAYVMNTLSFKKKYNVY
jgi:hypothetical protein